MNSFSITLSNLIPVIAKYPWAPPEAPLSAINVLSWSAMMWLVGKAVQVAHLGAVVH